MVVDADAIAREVVEPGTAGLAEVVAAFGEEVLAADGSLDRQALAVRAFSDEPSRQRLNAILHPLIGARTVELMATAAEDAVVVHDIPLLVESGLSPHYHLAVVVDAPVETRVERLVTSRGIDAADARARISAQSSAQERRAAADVWLDNGSTPDVLLSEVDKLWADRLVPFEANVRLRRTRPPSPAMITDYDPTWQRQAERLITRIRHAVGDRALRIDHIGSTAVPGLAAKDVLDLQLSVRSIADADEIAEPLTVAGFIRHDEIDSDSLQPDDTDPSRWRKRLHTNADPVRAANLHIRVDGQPAQRLALLFRDWLRADADARAEYARLKRELAHEHAADDTVDGYVLAKQPWVDAGFARAQRWARDTGWSQ